MNIKPILYAHHHVQQSRFLVFKILYLLRIRDFEVNLTSNKGNDTSLEIKNRTTNKHIDQTYKHTDT